MNKKYFVCSIILTFIMGFLVHNIYNWIPSIVTSIFPVNESLYEHAKLIFLSPLFSGIILYFYFKRKKYFINNFFFGIFISIIFNIIIFYLMYLPLYKMYGAIMWMTLLVYFISIILSQYLNYLIIEMTNNKRLNLISLIMIIIGIFILTYFTYHPLKIDFFKDPLTNEYGIKK